MEADTVARRLARACCPSWSRWEVVGIGVARRISAGDVQFGTEDPVATCGDTNGVEHDIKFRFPVSLWYCFVYPFVMLRTRTSCQTYIDIPLSVSTGIAESDFNAFKLSPNFANRLFSSFGSIYAKEGVTGFYRGCGPSIAHLALRESIRWGVQRAIHRPLQRWVLKCLAAAAGYDVVANDDGSVSIDVPTEDSDPDLAAQDKDSQQPLSQDCRRRPHRLLTPSFVDASSHLVPRCVALIAAEIFSYPCLTVATRVAVHNVPLGVWDTIKMSYNGDGLCCGFFGGIEAQLLIKTAELMTEFGIAGGRTRRRHLSWVEDGIVEASTTALLGVICSPLQFLSMVQRTQSSLPGLSSPSIKTLHILLDQPWKAIALQLAVALSLVGINFGTLPIRSPSVEFDPS